LKVESIATSGSVYVKTATIEKQTMRDYATKIQQTRKRRPRRPGWIRLARKQWAARPGVDKDYRPALKPGK